MAFFNLTQLGPQNPFHSHCSTDKSQKVTSNGESTKSDSMSCVGSDIPQPLPSLTSQMYGNHNISSSHAGSHTKFSEMRIKHQRNNDGPIETYEYPVTTSHNYGWWIKQSGHAPKWAQNAKHVHVNSEMTRFVDEMSLTNKGFTLF